MTVPLKAFRVTVDGFGEPPMVETVYAATRSKARMQLARRLLDAGWVDDVGSALLALNRIIRAPECDEPVRSIDPTMTDTDRGIMEHAIGEWTGRPGTAPYRNGYCAEKGDARLLALISRGWMRAGRCINKDDFAAHVTSEGFRALGLPVPKEGE